MFFAIIKAIHLLALMFGAGSSLGSIYLGLAKGPHDLAAPDYTNTLRKIYRVVGLAAVIALWVSGLILLFGIYGVWVPGFAFNAKIALVIAITLHLLFLNFMSPGWARSGGPPSYVPVIGMISTICLFLVVILATFAFS